MEGVCRTTKLLLSSTRAARWTWMWMWMWMWLRRRCPVLPARGTCRRDTLSTHPPSLHPSIPPPRRRRLLRLLRGSRQTPTGGLKEGRGAGRESRHQQRRRPRSSRVRQAGIRHLRRGDDRIRRSWARQATQPAARPTTNQSSPILLRLRFATLPSVFLYLLSSCPVGATVASRRPTCSTSPPYHSTAVTTRTRLDPFDSVAASLPTSLPTAQSDDDCPSPRPARRSIRARPTTDGRRPTTRPLLHQANPQKSGSGRIVIAASPAPICVPSAPPRRHPTGSPASPPPPSIIASSFSASVAVHLITTHPSHHPIPAAAPPSPPDVDSHTRTLQSDRRVARTSDATSEAPAERIPPSPKDPANLIILGI